MCLEESVASEELDQNTADAPNVARVAPTQVQDDLRRSVVSCADHRRMIFIIKRGRTKVNQSDLRFEQDLPELCVAIGGC